MLSFPSQIAKAAQDAGMKVPDDLSTKEPEKYVHWTVYCNVQLGVPVTWGNHWENAKIIAAIPEDELKKMKYEELVRRGFSP